MALLEEMQALVDDLEAAFSGRAAAERERLATATADGRERTSADHERRAAGARDADERAVAGRGQRARAAEDSRERLAEIAGRRGEIGELLAGFHAVHVAQAAQDGQERALTVRERRMTADRDSHERLAEIAGRQGEIGELLAGFRAVHVAQAAQDARERAAVGRDRVTADHERQAGAAVDARVRATAERERRMTALGEARERLVILGETHRVWQDHSAAIAGLRPSLFPSGTAAGGRPTAAPDKPAVPLARHATAPARAAAQPRPRAGGRGGAGRKSRAAASPANIYAYLAEHPDGVKLTELESHFHTPRIVLSRAVREMIAAKRVRRNEKSRLYFAA